MRGEKQNKDSLSSFRLSCPWTSQLASAIVLHTQEGVERMSMNDTKGAMSVNEFLNWASIGRTKFYDELASGRLKVRKVGRKTIVTMADALSWLECLPAQTDLKNRAD